MQTNFAAECAPADALRKIQNGSGPPPPYQIAARNSRIATRNTPSEPSSQTRLQYHPGNRISPPQKILSVTQDRSLLAGTASPDTINLTQSPTSSRVWSNRPDGRPSAPHNLFARTTTDMLLTHGPLVRQKRKLPLHTSNSSIPPFVHLGNRNSTHNLPIADQASALPRNTGLEGIHSPAELHKSFLSVSDSETKPVAQYSSESVSKPHVVPAETLKSSTQGFDTVENIFNCMEIVLSYAGTSKDSSYGGGAVSSLAALNCARLTLEMQRAGLRDEQLLKEIMERKTTMVRLLIILLYRVMLALDGIFLNILSIANTLLPFYSRLSCGDGGHLPYSTVRNVPQIVVD